MQSMFEICLMVVLIHCNIKGASNAVYISKMFNVYAREVLILCNVFQECKAHQVASDSILRCPVCHVQVDGDKDFVVIEAGSSVCLHTTG